MSCTLFLDESKARGYTIVVAAVLASDVPGARKQVEALRMKGQRRIHFVKEQDSRRRQLLARMSELSLQCHVYRVKGTDDRQARGQCLAAIVGDVERLGANRLVLERDDSIERVDRRVIRRALTELGIRDRVDYRHERAADEPLLWVPDAVGWSLGRGGDWRRRIEGLLAEVHDVRA